MHSIIRSLMLALLLAAAPAPGQERFSIFVPSEQDNVERMLKLAGLRDDDVVVDLGSGDGRIVLTAARLNSKLRGWGVDIDEKLVKESNAAAQAQGVAGRVQFFHRNAFDADLRDATVICMWFWPEMQLLLRPVILERARPGTRVVTNIWDLGSWKPDATHADGPIHMWIVPARVEGYWDWELQVSGSRIAYSAMLEQRFQAVEGVVRAGIRRDLLNDMKLSGDNLSFTLSLTVTGLGLVRHEFRGKVQGDAIVGTAKLSLPPHEASFEVPWRARRAGASGYFAPTGTQLD